MVLALFPYPGQDFWKHPVNCLRNPSLSIDIFIYYLKIYHFHTTMHYKLLCIRVIHIHCWIKLNIPYTLLIVTLLYHIWNHASLQSMCCVHSGITFAQKTAELSSSLHSAFQSLIQRSTKRVMPVFRQIWQPLFKPYTTVIFSLLIEGIKFNADIRRAHT